jgi:poly(A) polymerase
MRESLNNHRGKFLAPDAAAEEFTAAIEAATGHAHEIMWNDPMDGPGIADALDKLLLCPRPDRGLEVLVRSGVIASVLPEVQAIVGFGEGIRHKDVWTHTKKVITNTMPTTTVRWAALFHDIGKVPTRKFTSDGQVTFIGHPEVGARMFDRIAARLQLQRSMSEPIRFLITTHLRASAYDKKWTDSAVRRFAKDMDGALENLLDLSKADITSKYVEKVRRGTEQINLLARRIDSIKELDAKPKPLPKGLGTAIIDHFGIAPGPGLGRLIRYLTDEVETGNLELQREFNYYLAFLRENSHLLPDIPDGVTSANTP